MDTFILNWLVSIPVFSLPLLLACLGLIVTARSGVLNLGAEGMMAVGALFAIATVLGGGGLVQALAVSILAGTLLALVFGIAVVAFRTDQVLTGLIVFAMGLGLTGAIGRPYAHKPITGFQKTDWGSISDIPWIGPLLFGQDVLVYVSAALVVAVWYVIYRTPVGLRLRAVGEDPATADAAGINVVAYRLAAILVGGALCGLSGGYLALASGQIWVEGMTAGRGWIAIALAIFARWRPGAAVVGALIFGGTEAIIPRIQATGADVPVYFLLMLPYLLTLAVLIVPSMVSKSWKDAAPSALLTNYVREDRR